ncbi:diaminopimelate dehydrogenase [Fundicoccus sp. Sow4_D5]|uniref:diaminopimelate dehydrogenase n=1 Tax=Fundicoccus sp. Sow4_D5 TaxID=3438782 RepID=UPI003F8E9DAE
MSQTIRIGICGYGNLGRGVERSISQQADMSLVAIFSRRGKAGVEPLNPLTTVEHLDQMIHYQDKIDVMILCGGSATDLPEQTPMIAQYFNTIDSFDTHAKIPEHFAAVDKIAQKHQHVSIISVGWDPGLFSMNRVLAETVLPVGETYTFWGKGLSQGHSDALRRIEGVKHAVQYTIPSEQAIKRVRQGEQPKLSTGQKHTRECYVVLEAEADAEGIEQEIKAMPDYFAEYETSVQFISEATLLAEHNEMPHGGVVLRSGHTGEETKQTYEFNLTLGSNPEFTGSVLVAYARAAYRMKLKGQVGAKTVFDVTLSELSPKTPETLRKDYL